jgi:4-amino-4-deoxy-L-arabinose transferase-like glycosyltransferase
VSEHRSSLVTAVLLALILAGAWGLRYAYLAHAERTPGFAWIDPDGYTRQARALIGQDGRWGWSWAGVHYRWNNRTWVLPPGYPVFLSWFARDAASFPGNAGHVQTVLGALVCGLLFWLGARIHTARAGLVAAAIGAVWLPSVSMGEFFFQEQLYLPLLVLAFALVVEAWVRESNGPLFGVAGAAFGLAALTRAMALYFVPVGAVALVLGAPARGTGWRRAAWFAGTFTIVVLPYVVWLSAAHGQVILVDNHGSIEMRGYANAGVLKAPGVLETVRLLANEAAGEPVRFASEKANLVRGLFQLQGGRWLQYYGDSSSARAAEAWKWIAHAGIDLPFALVSIVAPLGLALARRPRQAVLLGLWVPELLLLSSVAGYAGARYRAPMEPHLIVLAAVVVAGQWRPAGKASILLGLCGSLVIAALVLPQVPRSLAAHAQYGITPWDGTAPGASTVARGACGINVLARSGAVALSVTLVDGDGTRRLPVLVWLDGRRAANLTIGGEPRALTLACGGPMCHVEFQPLVPEGQTEPAYRITAFP